MTFQAILQRMLDKISENADSSGKPIDLREGSVVYDALAPAAYELSRFYSALDNAVDQTFADSADRAHLIRRAAERGITPYSATRAVIAAYFEAEVPLRADVPLGARFSVGDLRYFVSEKPSNINNSAEVYKLTCEIGGTVGNRTSGDLIPVDYIEGLTAARITALAVPGEDDESTEHLRKRYFDSLEAQCYGGNIADYRRMAMSVQGVGGVKVYPAWNGGGTVKLVIQDYEYNTPSQNLVNLVKNLIDPDSGEGTGLAPIGHTVTVTAATTASVNITAKFTMEQGWSVNSIMPILEAIAEDYLKEIAADWDSVSNIIVRVSQLEARMLDGCKGKIKDIENFRFNNGVIGKNLTLAANDIPTFGGVSHVN